MKEKVYIPHFDIMKGLAIIIVVLGHVLIFSFGIDQTIANQVFFFNMPIFFYISGYLAYRHFFSFRDLILRLFRRGMVLIVPYIVFLTSYSIFSNEEHIWSILIGGGQRYWFLYALFFLSEFFMIWEFLTRKLCVWYTSVIMWLLPLGCLIFIKLSIRGSADVEDNNMYHIITMLTNYYRYFLIGYLCKKYIYLENLLFRNKIVYAAGVIIYFANLYWFDNHNIILIFLGSLGAIIVIQNFLCGTVHANSRLGKVLTMIGRCSLGIYVIHYFFIPVLPTILDSLLYCGNPLIWQLTLALMLSIPIIVASILAYRLIEYNQYLFLICFGKLPVKIGDRLGLENSSSHEEL